MAEINPDQIGDFSPNDEIDFEAGVFGAHIRARPFKDQPKRAEFHMIGRYARKLKTNDYPMVRQSVQSCALSEGPYQVARIEIGQPYIARMNKAPVAELAHDSAKSITGRREP